MSVKYNFEGKNVLVTGGGRGLGKTIVEKFITSNCLNIFVLDQDKTLVDTLNQQHTNVCAIQCDISNWSETKKAIETFGTIHYLVNNAAVMDIQPFLDITPDSIDKLFQVNVKAVINICQIVASQMIKDDICGSIVNISSVLDNVSLPGMMVYGSLKSALSQLSKCIALELAPYNIRVNCIKPSAMITGAIAEDLQKEKMARKLISELVNKQITKRVVLTEEAADAVLFLCSDAAKMINGSGVYIDGGMFT